ncbi:MAG: hypothetical protein DBX93_05205 [Oscillospiraceae bacterium]|nr:MAG: hypothetical protein DBX93_05205 [Oscillospiraceae bacterium]
MSDKIKNIVTVLLAAVFLFGFSAWSLLLPDAKESTSERRYLAQFPAVSKDSILSGKFMTGFEDWSLDQFPLRDNFRTLKAFTAFYLLRQKDNNDIYVVGGQAAKLDYPMHADSLDYAASRFAWIYENLLKDADTRVWMSIVPDKNYFLAKANGYPSMDYAAFIAALREKMPYADYVDILDALAIDDYYTTDAHWRQEKLSAVAEKLADALGITIDKDYSSVTSDVPFYGVYYGQSALPLPADTLIYLTNETLAGCRVYDYETDSYIPVYDTDLLGGKDPYQAFLSGSKSLLRIENPAATNDRELILFRDSFGSSLAPLLASGYAKITLVDIRYISPNLLGRFVDFGGKDVLFLYSTSVLNSSELLK